MAWIKTIDIPEAEATDNDELLTLLNRIKGPNGNVDNIMLVHSLRPHTMRGHMALYKYVLHHFENTVPEWFAEAIGVYVSKLNCCSYCYDHHAEGMKRLLKDQPEKADKIMEAINKDDPAIAFDGKEQAAMRYAAMLTRIPHTIGEAQIEGLRKHGWSDGEILEINQVVAYFAYANRTVLGLGVNTEGDILGLSPNKCDDPNDWNHN